MVMKTEERLKKIERSIFFQNIIIIILLGVILNLSVIIFNDSKMPIFFKDVNTPVNNEYVVFNNSEDINYYFLSDIFKLGRLRFSIGDVLMIGGLFSIFVLGILRVVNIILNKLEDKHGTTISNR